MPARAETGTTAVLLIDGSGSMWGKMDGDSAVKFYSVRDELRGLLARTPNQARVGLGSFGHRRKGDCSDVEIIAPAEAGGAGRVIEVLEKLSPKGKGPVAGGMRAAAQTFGPDDTGHIVLIHDNADNCQQDVCAAASDIAKVHPKVAIHVIGLGLSQAERDRMQCVSTTTQGRHLHVSSQPELSRALSEIFDLARLTPESAPVAPKVAETPAPAPKGAPGLRLTAALVEGGAMLEEPLAWTIEKADAGPQEAPLVERKSPEINEPLPPGRYRVGVTHGLVTRRAEMDVGTAGPTASRISLDAGVISFKASATKLGDKLHAPVVTLFGSGEGGSTQLTPLWVGRQGAGDLVVPAGRYTLRVVDGHARASSEIEVTAGAKAQREVVLDTGQLELSVSESEGGPMVEDVVYAVEVDDVDAVNGRREIARSAAPLPSFTLQAGTYYVSAHRGAASVRERIAVSSGDLVKRTLVIPLARIAVRPVVTGATPPADQAIITRLMVADEGRRPVGYSTEPQPTFLVGPGRYRIESQLGASNVRASTVVDAAGSGENVADISMPASELVIEPAGPSRPETFVRTQVRDAAGRTVWRSRPGQPLRTLVAPGSYTVRVEEVSGTVDHKVTLSVGERHVVAVNGS